MNIELERTFEPVSADKADSGDYDFTGLFGLGKRTHWDDLLQNKRVVIIAEAGAGKTHEFRAQADKLNDQKKTAFFVRLEYLKDGLETAFESGEDFLRFEQWKNSDQDAYFFLDSVDEAKLGDPKDFERGLIVLNRKLDNERARSTIILSSRPNFRPVSEIEYFNRHLPHPPIRKKTDEHADTPEASKISQDVEDCTAVIFSLSSLNQEQIKEYANAKGVTDADELVEEINRANAASFAARPRDLDGIISTWRSEKKIGSKKDIIDANVKRRLSEDDFERDLKRPLSGDKARAALRAIAAACTLTSVSRIAVPDKEHAPNALSIKEILTGWNATDIDTLLQRPIFDDCAYGTVRFHDRDIREYLTAEWFENLLEKGSRPQIEAIFFQDQYGVTVTRPKLRPVLAWLCLVDDRIRDRTQKTTPHILLEHGDPAQFPTEFKKQILQAVCHELSQPSKRHSFDTASLERFSDADLADFIVDCFREYGDHPDVVDLLLRIVWHGRITQCASVAKEIACNPSAGKYTRIYAVRACSRVCTEQMKHELVEHFLSEKTQPERLIVEEFLELYPSQINPKKIIKFAQQVSPPERFSSDGLDDALNSFVANMPTGPVVELFTGLAELALSEPHLERKYVGVSSHYKWLLQPVAKIAELLVKARHAVITSDLGLEVLSQCGTFRDSGYDDGDFKTKLKQVVPKWPELNEACFWHDVQRARNERNYEIRRFWQVDAFGCVWSLDHVTFECAVGWIATRPLEEDKLIALSLAFEIYRSNGRNRKEREALKAACTGISVLEQQLKDYFHPPAMSQEEKNSRKREQRFNKRMEEREARQKKNIEDWRTYAANHLDQVKHVDPEGEGKTFPVQGILFERMREKKDESGRWANTNWEHLIEDQSRSVAEAFREFLVTTWKNCTPQLCSEGASENNTYNSVIYGLSGLGVLAKENRGWTSDLSEHEAELACRYALLELNGPPSWFRELFEAFPEVVVQMVSVEIAWELFEAEGDQPPHYVLQKISWHCDWMFGALTPRLVQNLTKSEVCHEDSLNKTLQIILNSGTDELDQLVELAATKAVAPKTVHRHLWLAVCVSLEPERGIELLSLHLEMLANDCHSTTFAMKFILALMGGRRSGGIGGNAGRFERVRHLCELYMLMNQHIHMSSDIERAGKGVYSPGLRDDAQDARSALLNQLTKIPGKDTYLALTRLAAEHPFDDAKVWMENNAQTHLETEADLPDWLVEDVVTFAEKQECRPVTPRDLYNVACIKVSDLKSWLEHGDDSAASSWAKEDQETRLRNLMAGWLRDKTNGNFTVHQEEEQADAKRPDIRFHSQRFDAPIPVELKIADKRWSGEKLLERLENQLCNDYLRDFRTNFGIFLVVRRGLQNSWKIGGLSYDFDDMVKCLQKKAKELSRENAQVEAVDVIGIDLALRNKALR